MKTWSQRADHRVRLDTPARVWAEALPLGNGHLAAMCFADPGDDRFALNHDTVWSGSPRNERARFLVDSQHASAAIAEARSALAAGDRPGADAAVRRLQAGYSQAFLPLGDLRLRREGAPTLRRRELDLARAVHAALADDGTLRRSYVSAPDGVLVVESEFPEPADVTVSFEHPLHELRRVATGTVLEVRLRAPSDVAPHHEAAEPPVSWSAAPGDAVQAVVQVAAVTDGRVSVTGGALAVEGATRLRVLLACETTFQGAGLGPDGDIEEAAARATEVLCAAARADPAELLARHVADHAALYDRFELTLPALGHGAVPGDTVPEGAPSDSAAPSGNLAPSDSSVSSDFLGPTDEPDTAARLAAARATGAPMAADPALAALLLHYGRYLLIASSRPGSLPATLQGMWNAELRPPWSSSYTVNINTQMNYWGAETAALAECHEPLAALVAGVARNGREVARRLYGARGWVAHHNTDAWAFASPVGQGVADPAWAFWPMAGPWLGAHLVERVRFAGSTERRAELAAEAWPVLTGAVAFLRDWVVELEPGVWGSPLATSPENVFRTGVAGRHAAVARHAAMDGELVHDVAVGALELAEILRLQADPTAIEAAWLLEHVVLPRVGADGGTAEWFDDETPTDPHHRHVSMLYGSFPGSRELSAQERDATIRSLDLRGDDSTGWSLVWKIALRARLGQEEKVSDLLELLARDATRTSAEHAGGLYPNLFAAHPPFQIDGNLGFVGAVLECLVQSHRREGDRTAIELLPALPPAWRTGAVRGVRVRGGLSVDVAWREGVVERVELSAEPGSEPTTVLVRGGGLDTVVDVPGGVHVVLVARA